MDPFAVCHDLQGDGKTDSDPTSGPDERLNPELTAEETPTQLLAELERDDPKLAFQAARILGLYRRLWDSCMSKHTGSEKLRQTNQELRRENTRL
ncbi:hypothetical protein N7481_010207 [Penicillium waksmanii]|uniref:uncharacterized protein n=1 Tax=Penicillium waksmanii TaxID=69791 RepID=UPI0025499D39|nr:uncharacterized protein N7481_010207 [Penicillium waksmanii]KAJ5976500.1 hypothetical protein N7481_010207 [Penicillium waksmanii]